MLYSSSKISIKSALETALETTLTLKRRTRSLIIESPNFDESSELQTQTLFFLNLTVSSK